MQVLMLSSSRVGDESYLEHAIPMINAHLSGITELVFIPFAGVSISWDEYTNKVQTALPHLNIKGLHQFADAEIAIQSAQAIAVGGGNTFNLLHQVYEQELINAIKDKVNQGTPYIGWSAGSNICGNSIRTTNDMPIVQPKSFEALNLVPFQLNPHYTDYQPPGHNGETRAERIQEFCTLNPTTPVIGIREGCALLLQQNKLTLKGELEGVVFEAKSISILKPEQDLSHYL
ncbi:dipeptidase PepE [Paraglaciecola aquimarina]|uniref:Dipeptidase PepE n=1 Tax=Paraglaciecola algarum TaxID=3050085 RepID=A0ABS9D438_9ALTE|nr:dipeptidase PepE [Paraglaciecola sp. G1-23]MCF2946584.1 dipeptidase PepE [Paraglaciecola sp. G1-23]